MTNRLLWYARDSTAILNTSSLTVSSSSTLKATMDASSTKIDVSARAKEVKISVNADASVITTMGNNQLLSENPPEAVEVTGTLVFSGTINLPSLMLKSTSAPTNYERWVGDMTGRTVGSVLFHVEKTFGGVDYKTTALVNNMLFTKYDLSAVSDEPHSVDFSGKGLFSDYYQEEYTAP